MIPEYIRLDAEELLKQIRSGKLNPLKLLKVFGEHNQECRCSICLVSTVLWMGPDPRLTDSGELRFPAWTEEEIAQVVGRELVDRWKAQISVGTYPTMRIFTDPDTSNSAWLLKID